MRNMGEKKPARGRLVLSQPVPISTRYEASTHSHFYCIKGSLFLCEKAVFKCDYTVNKRDRVIYFVLNFLI